MEERIEGRLEVTIRRGRRRRKLPWMTLRKRENAGNWKRKHQFALCGELALEETMDLS